MSSYRTIDVPVEGGLLRAGLWGRKGPVVLCSHGITANHIWFQALARELSNDFLLVAPDHRGRGQSRDITGPWGMKAHAADCIALLNHLGLERADTMVGHSMGGFISVVTRAVFSERVSSILLVDGGLPLMDEVPSAMTTEQLLQAVIGPVLERLETTFESADAYKELWKQHPAFVGHWSQDIEDLVVYDLVGAAPEFSPSPLKEAVIADTENQWMTSDVLDALSQLAGPVRFLAAEQGLLDENPIYPESLVSAYSNRIKGFSWAKALGVNHCTLLVGPAGVRVVANEVRALCGMDS